MQKAPALVLLLRCRFARQNGTTAGMGTATRKSHVLGGLDIGAIAAARLVAWFPTLRSARSADDDDVRDPVVPAFTLPRATGQKVNALADSGSERTGERSGSATGDDSLRTSREGVEQHRRGSLFTAKVTDALKCGAALLWPGATARRGMIMAHRGLRPLTSSATRAVHERRVDCCGRHAGRRERPCRGAG